MDDEIVPVQAVRQRNRRLRQPRTVVRRGSVIERAALRKVDIQIAVVVEIEQRDAGREDLGEVVVARPSR